MQYRNLSSSAEDYGNRFATEEDFCFIFRGEMKALYLLAWLITADPANAEKCLVSGLDDCLQAANVLTGHAHSWARRMIAKNAIRILRQRPEMPQAPLQHAVCPRTSRTPPHCDPYLERVMALGEFERLVFVLCVLEGYSEADCALLIRCSPQQIGSVRGKALTQIAESSPDGGVNLAEAEPVSTSFHS